jgi:ABC-type phosphate transport system permease subunit
MGAVQKMVLNKLPVVAPSVSRGVSLWDAVPNEVRDASLSLGTTE